MVFTQIANIFSRNKVEIVCPRCLRQINTKIGSEETCPTCRFSIPIRYIEYYKSAPPIFIQVFGWTNHGKTMFLDTLRLVLMDMHALWPDNYTYESLTQLDVQKERELQAKRRKGQLADSTQPRERNQNEVYIMHLKGMDRWTNRMLTIMDHPGEYFSDFSVPVDEIPFLINTPTTIMLISLPDVLDDSRNQAGERIDQLLNIYLEALKRERVDFKKDRRKLVIVFTKADITRGLPANLRHYLLDDNIWRSITTAGAVMPLKSTNLVEYLERMQRVSDEIQQWIRSDRTNVPGGANMLALLRDHNIDVRFALMSALGRDIDQNGGSGFNITPYRVLDAFFWALEFQSR